MNNNLFKVIYSGHLKEGFEINQVAAQFAIKFKITPEKALKILQAGRDVTLNKKTEHVKAYKLKSTFEEIGLQVRLERVLLLVSNHESQEQKTDKEEEKQDQQKKSLDEQLENNATLSKSKASNSWTLDPIEQQDEEDENVSEGLNNNRTGLEENAPRQVNKVKKEDFNYTGLSNAPVIDTNKPKKDSESSEQSTKDKLSEENKEAQEKNSLVDILIEFVKKFGGVIAGIFLALFVVLKKFGLFKLLKIGIIFGAASFAGFESEELCMGNSQCEEVIDNQLDMCWYDKGFDDYDWDDMSDEEYYQLKPRLETEVLACFIYDSGESVFLSPIEVRFDLIEFCYESEYENCNELVEPQIKSCFNQHNLNDIIDADTIDYLQAIYENKKTFTAFYSCFVDENGQQIFNIDLSTWQ